MTVKRWAVLWLELVVPWMQIWCHQEVISPQNLPWAPEDWYMPKHQQHRRLRPSAQAPRGQDEQAEGGVRAV